MTRVVVAVVAHPDDEVLGCGGTLARHIEHGDEVHVVFLTDGVGARAGGGNEQARVRKASAEGTALALGGLKQHWLGFPDNRMDSASLLDVTQAIESAVMALSPSVVYTHHCGDLNIDHELASRAVLTAFRPIPGGPSPDLFAFETVSSTEWFPGNGRPFQPNYFVDIGRFLARKMSALEAYSMEMRPEPHARSVASVQALARFRGCSVGIDGAEAFEVLRAAWR